MSASKDKGRRLENMTVDLLAEYGIAAERIPLSGSLGGKYSSDVVIGSVDKPLGRIECKNRESLSAQLWEWLEPVDFLVLKRNHKKPLVMMSFDQFAALVAKYTN